MTQPPPLPVIAAPAPARRVLGVISAETIVAGQVVANGTVYVLTFMGIAGGATFLIKDTFATPERPVHALAFVAPVLTFGTMLLVYGSLFSALCASVYIACSRRPHTPLARLMIAVFAFLAISTALGIVSMRCLEARSDFHGTPLFAPYLFLWSVTFAVLAIAYARFFPKPRNA